MESIIIFVVLIIASSVLSSWNKKRKKQEEEAAAKSVSSPKPSRLGQVAQKPASADPAPWEHSEPVSRQSAPTPSSVPGGEREPSWAEVEEEEKEGGSFLDMIRREMAKAERESAGRPEFEYEEEPEPPPEVVKEPESAMVAPEKESSAAPKTSRRRRLSKGNVRQGIVWMEILGPCRAGKLYSPPGLSSD